MLFSDFRHQASPFAALGIPSRRRAVMTAQSKPWRDLSGELGRGHKVPDPIELVCGAQMATLPLFLILFISKYWQQPRFRTTKSGSTLALATVLLP
jgi:hypothetical protein